MENKTIAKSLRLLSQLMELHDGNPFKIKSLASAAYTIGKLPFSLSKKSLQELEQISAIGKSTAAKVWELTQTKTIKELEELYEITPHGVIEIMGIKGLGPKKVLTIWKDMQIEDIGELLYACNENRLIEAKGFGAKTQEEIKKAIEFKMASNGRFLYAHVEEYAEYLIERLRNELNIEQVSFTGDYRRKCEIIDGLDVLIGSVLTPDLENAIRNISSLEITDIKDQSIEAENTSGIKVYFNFYKNEDFYTQLAFQTGVEKHTEELKKRLGDVSIKASSEEDVFAKAGLQYIEPELREGRNEFVLADAGKLPKLVTWEDLKGSLHNHSTWSDGVNTIEQMALFCRDELKLQYLGISDHSKSAFYAKGLYEERVLAQHEEIDTLNQKLNDFKIFKGIESDILFDGSLDYAPEILATFDFVVASIHSVFKMNEEKATSRLITAIENPYTTILGHPSGRLLLSRSGYPVDFKKVIDACAANGVVIEINANPLRLDIDWRWHQYALEKGVMLSINPDAHNNNGFYDTHFGLLAARKGGVSAENCLNAKSLEEITQVFNSRKSLV
ncbi:MAG: helix-hairpin-helix domain-containing protein [Sphingobacteriaceae bacterium]